MRSWNKKWPKKLQKAVSWDFFTSSYQEGSFSISDSSVIIAYLEKAYPKKGLYPKSAKELAHALWLEEYADTCMTDVLHKKVYFELINKPKLNMATDFEIVKQAIEKEIPPIFDYLETQLQSSYAGKFLVGDQLTIADIGVGTHFFAFQKIAKQTVDSHRYPLLDAYLQRLYNEPIFKNLQLL